MKSALSATSLLLALLFAGPAYAQERDTTATPPQQADTTAKPVATLEPLVVTVSRVPLPIDRVGFALSLVTAEELALERPLYSADALRTLPGAYIDEAAGPGGPTIVRLRGGEEVFTQILMDGVKVNQNGGFFDFQGLTLSNLERVEVARGPQSALFGSSAVSGVVHFISRRGELGPPRFGLLAEGGNGTENGGSFRAAADVSGGADWLRYSGGLGTAYYRGIYDIPNDTWTREGTIRLDALPSSRWNVTGVVRHIGVEGDLPVRDPGATRVPLDPNARNERDRTLTSVRATFAPSNWSHTLTGSLYLENFIFEDQRDDVAEQGDFDFFIFDADFKLDSDLMRSTVEYTGSYSFAPAAGDGLLTLSYGAGWEREELEDRTSGEFGDGVQQLDRNSIAGFAEVETDLIPRTDFLIGVRAEKYEDLSTELTPRASARVGIIPSVLFARAAAGRAYKAPNLQQQYLDNPFIASNPDLEAETSTSWEIGLDAQVSDARVGGGLTYFRQDFDNLIRTVAQENSTQQINRNLGSARAQGVEWMLWYRPTNRWLVGTEGAWIDTEVLDNTGLSESQYPEGEALPFRPDLVGSAFVELSPIDRLTAIVRGSYVGEQTVLSERFSGERIDLDPYLLVGLRLNYDLSRRLQLYARFDNLFDTAYETAYDRTGIPLTAAMGVQAAAGSLAR
ncbi:MAG: TonB-dependent receptor [Gemmatimonadota bacterium]|nr:MAG: TonB-dependent receptor [Gemmatimonadota bacterium]